MIKVCGHRLLVKPIDYLDDDPTVKRAKETLGLVIPELEENKRAKESVDRGTVIQIGPTAWRDFNSDPWCQIGDTIVYAKFAGKLIVDPDTQDKYVALNDEDVVAVLGESL